jgi:alkylated DNA nucleotide flippase Atl1
MSLKPKKSWQEKLTDTKGLPKVVAITGGMSRKWGTGTLVIPAPLEVDALMRKVPKGKVVTVNRLRAALARQHGATTACPITTGIFSWIAAHAAVEAQTQGRKRVTPWWRTLKAGGELNPKFPGGVETQARLLRAEGHTILPAKGKKPPKIAGIEGRLAM